MYRYILTGYIVLTTLTIWHRFGRSARWSGGEAAFLMRQTELSRANDMTTATDEELLTYRDAAALLKVSARTLERWTREGLVPYIRLPQRGAWSGIRFSRSRLQLWLRQRTIKER